MSDDDRFRNGMLTGSPFLSQESRIEKYIDQTSLKEKIFENVIYDRETFTIDSDNAIATNSQKSKDSTHSMPHSNSKESKNSTRNGTRNDWKAEVVKDIEKVQLMKPLDQSC